MGGKSKAQKEAESAQAQLAKQESEMEAQQKQTEEEQTAQLKQRQLALIRRMQGGGGLSPTAGGSKSGLSKSIG